jgi:hypothetical protein
VLSLTVTVVVQALVWLPASVTVSVTVRAPMARRRSCVRW